MVSIKCVTCDKTTIEFESPAKAEQKVLDAGWIREFSRKEAYYICRWCQYMKKVTVDAVGHRDEYSDEGVDYPYPVPQPRPKEKSIDMIILTCHKCGRCHGDIFLDSSELAFSPDNPRVDIWCTNPVTCPSCRKVIKSREKWKEVNDKLENYTPSFKNSYKEDLHNLNIALYHLEKFLKIRKSKENAPRHQDHSS